MWKAAIAALFVLVATCPTLAASPYASPKHPHVTCDMVRAYVAKVGVKKAKAMARAHGITAVQAQKARRCLANSV